MSDWRSIESAPLNGAMVVLCRAVDADAQPIAGQDWDRFVQVGAWSDHDGDWVVHFGLRRDPRLPFEPTHWMPLPPHPLSGEPPGGE